MTQPTVVTGVPVVAIGDQSPCAETHLTQADFLALFDRIMPYDYLAAMKALAGPGYEYFQAVAKSKERLSLAIARTECGAYVTTAHGPVKATALVGFSRPNADAGAVIVLRGTVVSTSVTGRGFVTTEDAIFGAADLGPIEVQVQAQVASYQWNVTGPVTTASGEILPGEIDTIDLPLQDPPYGDPSITVAQVSDATGGRPGTLDELGKDRGVERQQDEPDALYRARIRTLPDTVSPAAMLRQIANYMRPYVDNFDVTSAFIELWDIRYQTCWFAKPDGVGGSFPGRLNQFNVEDPRNITTEFGFDPNLFCYDDPRPNPPFRNRWLDDIDYRGAFVVVVPNLPAVSDYGMAYDDTAMDATNLMTPLGRRAVGAYDMTGSLPEELLPGFYDGVDTGKASIYYNLWRLLQDIKVGGNAASLELEGQ